MPSLAVHRATPSKAAVLFGPERLRRIARVWLVVAGALLLARLYGQTRAGLTDGAGHPFGEDFVNFWSGPALAVQGRLAEIYDIARFHRFEVAAVGHPIDLYHYSYPPVMLLFTAPLGLLPYPVAWALWTGLGWLAFAAVVRAMMARGWALYAAALPAVWISVAGGQNGCWTAAILGGGLQLLKARPFIAGLVLSLLAYKPQLAWLVPVALLAGGHWRALAGLAAGGVASLGGTLLLFGPDIWLAFAAQAELLRVVIFENGSGTWHRMVSVFVLFRHAGAGVGAAYAAQALVSVAVAAAVARVWRSQARAPARYSVVVLGVLIASPYVSDYDLVAAALVPLWLWRDAGPRARTAMALPVIAPLFAAQLALASGIALGALAAWPAFAYAVAASRREAECEDQAKAGLGRDDPATREPMKADASSTAAAR